MQFLPRVLITLTAVVQIFDVATASLGSPSLRLWAVRPAGLQASKSSVELHPVIGGGNVKKGGRPIDEKEALVQINEALLHSSPRGGQIPERVDGLARFVGTITQGLISCGRTVLPPTVAVIGRIVNFYRALPTDAVVAQIGLVYCFAGGYYPTLFSSLQAAQQCGWQIMVHSIQDLTDEAIKVIDATADLEWDSLDRKELFLTQTNIVLKTVDPLKINQAAAALYTTWLGISAVLEKEYARVISLSMTLAGYLEKVAQWVVVPVVKLGVNKDYHKWVTVIVGWGCKAAAMNIAWRIQRVLTASTSAMAGGLMFARAILRMLHKRGVHLFGLVKDSEDEMFLDDIIGFAVAGVGFYTQIETQFRNGFSFEVPFPLNLVTWPFDWLERWIQWQITK